MSKALILLLPILALASSSYSQSITTDSLAKRITTIEESLSPLKKIKFTGYIQTQWQKADELGTRSIAGGNFDPNMDNRFLIRRSRLKMTYSSAPVTAVIQIDALAQGPVIRDAYGAVVLPGPLKNFTLQSGLFYRPFGYEVQYSSGVRETPERSRMTQTLLPDERDLGAKLVFHLEKWKLEGGLFNGNGIALENDSKKDFIGRISTADHTFGKITIGGGVSAYNGFVREGTNHVFDFEKDHFIIEDTTINHVGKFAKREYVGADLQLSMPWAAGKTTIRADVIYGTQPGAATSSQSPRTSALPDKDTYIRPCQGAVVYFIQNFGKSSWQGVFKYDFYDPNRKVSGDKIGDTGTLLNEGDLKYTTYGIGLNYYFKTVTFMAYYDIVKNETSSHLNGYSKDLKDNVLTLRVQYKY